MFPCLEETLPDERRGKQGKGERRQPCVAIIRDGGEANGIHVAVALPSTTPSETGQCLEGGA